jgi:cobalt-zinc-cadmium efflux system outer membrane protein
MKTTTSLLLLTIAILRAESAVAGDEIASGESGQLSLAEVTHEVLHRNQAIQEALHKWEAAKQRVTQEAAWDDLRLSGTSKVRRYIDVPPNAFTDQMLSVEQLIPITGKNRVRARVATADAVIAFEEARRAQLDVLAKTRTAYFRLTNAYAQIELNRKNYTSLTQIAEINRSRYEVGTQTAADVLMSETEAAKLLEMRSDLERNLATAQSQLNVLMNRDAFAPLGSPREGPIPHTDLFRERLHEVTLDNRPEVRAAKARVAAETSKLQLAQRAWIPDPSLKVEGQRYNESRDSLSEVNAGISFNVPWVNPGKYSAAIKEANANNKAARSALERIQTEAMGAVREALEKARTAHHHVELFRDKLVPQARQTFEASQFAYESGKATFSNWIGAQRLLRDLEAEGRELLTDYPLALAELESTVGADLHFFPPTEKQQHKQK